LVYWLLYYRWFVLLSINQIYFPYYVLQELQYDQSSGLHVLSVSPDNVDVGTYVFVFEVFVYVYLVIIFPFIASRCI
jgi:hypothetical protein